MTEGLLRQHGLIIPVASIKKAFGNKYVDFLIKLTITCPQKVGPPKKTTMYKFEKIAGIDCIHLPRFTALPLLKGGIISKLDVAFPPKRPIAADLKNPLFPNQELIVRHLMENVYTQKNLDEGFASCTHNLRAGMGKTFVAAGMIAQLKLRTLYIVPKRPLMVQTVKDLKMCFHDEEDSKLVIGAFESKPAKRDPTRNHRNQDITVIVIDSALNQSAEFFSGYSFVIFDEVHSYVSDARKEIFWKCHTHAMLGISATTEDRSDGFDPVFHKQLGPIIRAEQIPGFTYENVEFDCTVHAIMYSGPPQYTQNLTHEKTGRIFTPYMNKQFLQDPYRMRLFVQNLRNVYNWTGPQGQKHCVYVFCEEREPLVTLKARLREEFAKVGLEPKIEAPEAEAGDDECAICLDKLGEKDGGVCRCPTCNKPFDVTCLADWRKHSDTCPLCRANMNNDAKANDDIGNFVGGIKDTEIINFKNNCRILLTTYGYSGTGVSIDKMTAIFFATPRKANMKQILARILRRGGDISIPRIIMDFVDVKTAIKRQFGARCLAYDFYSMKVIQQKIKWDEVQD